MKIFRSFLPTAILAVIAVGAAAQVESGSVVRRRSERDAKKKTENAGPQVTPRMQGFYETKEPHDADLAFMRQIYREIDLNKDANQPLYYPEDVIDGQQNLFRIILGMVIDGRIPAYEYLDGREIFTDQYKVNVGEMLDRFGIYATQAPGSTEKNPRYVIEEADVPTGQVMTYYILEKWEFDRRSNQMKTRVEAICPVLTRASDFGGDVRYPMFWVKFDQLRPFLAQQYVFLSDNNNLPQYSLDDYFVLGMYDGDIYKTRNLRNLSMNQLYGDEDDRKRAQDSIDRSLREFGKNLWVPTREEYLAQKERAEAAAKGVVDSSDSIPESTVVEEAAKSSSKTVRTSKRKTTTKKRATKTKVKNAPAPKSSNANSNATKSVRRRKK